MVEFSKQQRNGKHHTERHCLRNAYHPSEVVSNTKGTYHLASAYRKLLNALRNPTWTTWLAEWEIVFTQCKTMNLPEVCDNRVSVDFLDAVKAIDRKSVV